MRTKKEEDDVVAATETVRHEYGEDVMVAQHFCTRISLLPEYDHPCCFRHELGEDVMVAQHIFYKNLLD